MQKRNRVQDIGKVHVLLIVTWWIEESQLDIETWIGWKQMKGRTGGSRLCQKSSVWGGGELNKVICTKRKYVYFLIRVAPSLMKKYSSSKRTHTQWCRYDTVYFSTLIPKNNKTTYFFGGKNHILYIQGWLDWAQCILAKRLRYTAPNKALYIHSRYQITLLNYQTFGKNQNIVIKEPNALS